MLKVVLQSKELAIAEDCPGTELNDQPSEIVEKNYLGHTIGAGGDVIDRAIAKIRSGWNKFRDLVPWLASRSLPSGTKVSLYSACERSVKLYGSEIWTVKEQDVI